MSLALQTISKLSIWVYLCGPMRMLDGSGNSILPRTRKSRAVLAILALASPKAVSRDRICSLLWSRRGHEQARGSLRQCVHELHGVLDAAGSGILEAGREQLRLVPDMLWLDIRDPGSPRGGALLEDLTELDPAFSAWLQTHESTVATRSAGGTTTRRTRLVVRTPRGFGSATCASLAEGLASEILAAASRFRSLACLPAGVTSQEPVTGEYVLDGTVRQLGKQVRVTLRLEDSKSAGTVVWARNFELGCNELFDLQDRIAEQVAAQIDPELLFCEGRHAAERLAASSAEPADLTLAAIPGILKLDREGFDRSGAMLTEAARQLPEDAATQSWLAYWIVLAVGQGWMQDPASAMGRAADLVERAVTLDPSDARALTIAGHVRAFLHRQTEDAIVLHERAIALNPALSLAWAQSGLALSYKGEHHEAMRRIDSARSLSPFDAHAFFFDMALTMPCALLGDFERAAALGRLTTQLKPGFSSSWKGLLFALGHLGRTEEAADVLQRLLTLEPGFRVKEALRRSPLQRPEDLDCYAEGLRRGGLPE